MRWPWSKREEPEPEPITIHEPLRECPKCGLRDMPYTPTLFGPLACASWVCIWHAGKDVLEFTCPHCRYVIVESCKDAKP